MKKVFSFDAETNGLWGQAFAVSIVTQDENGKINTWAFRCPIEGEVNPWVEENVLPQMENIEVNCDTYNDLLKCFISVYNVYKHSHEIISHVAFPVEAKLLLDAHERGYLGDWDAPFPLIDISAFPEIGISVDKYICKNEISVPEMEGGTHNPLYDSYAALVAYNHIMDK